MTTMESKQQQKQEHHQQTTISGIQMLQIQSNTIIKIATKTKNNITME